MKIRKARSIFQDLCDCGCGSVFVYLCDEDGKAFACFSMDEDQWLPFAQDAVRLCHGQEPHGPEKAAVMQ